MEKQDVATEPQKIESSVVAALYVHHAAELERFLVGVIGDRELAKDITQIAFARLLEQGGPVDVRACKAWLFRVAYHEAMARMRRAAVDGRALRRLAETTPVAAAPADAVLMRREAVVAVRAALDRLPPEQRQIVRMRLYEGKTFASVAQQLGIPLGTALGRMRAALRKLRAALRERE